MRSDFGTSTTTKNLPITRFHETDLRAKNSDLIDRLIGRNIRFHRVKKQLSQTQLGDGIHVTFQQVQKYENAANRIPASRLFSIGQVLKIPVAAFFDGLELTRELAEAPTPFLPSLTAEREKGRVIQAYSQITDANLRRRIVELLEEIARR